MKAILAGLVASTLVATPAMAVSWKTELFAQLDADKSGELSIVELKNTGCKPNPKLFRYADKDASSGLSRGEFFNNRYLFKGCK